MSILTSEAIVRIADLQQITPEDLNAASRLARGSTDTVVAAFLAGSLVYSGMGVAPDVVATRAVVDTGKLFDGASGAGYALRDPFTVDLGQAIGAIPAGKQAKVAILVAGEDAASVLEQRTALDASREPTNPEDYWPTVTISTTTRQVRTAIVSKVIGPADAQPEMPAYNAAFCLIATIVIAPSGLVSIEQNTSLRVVRLDQVAAIVSAIAAWRAGIEPEFASLKASVSSFALQLAAFQGLYAEIAKLNDRINALTTQAQAVTLPVLTGQDNFLDESRSSPGAAGYSARIAQGLRFPVGVPVDVPILPQNPFSGAIRIINNKLLPAYTEATAARTGASVTENHWQNYFFGGTALRLNTLPAPTLAGSLRGFGQQKIQWDRFLTAASVSQVLSAGDPTKLFTIGGVGDVVYDPAWGDWRLRGPEITREPGFWSDLSTRGLWDRVLTGLTLSGVPTVAQRDNRAGAEMITAVGLGFQKSTVPGPVRLLVVADKNGQPDFSRTYADVSAPQTSLVVPDEGGGRPKLRFELPYPIYKPAGTALWYVWSSTADITLRALPVQGGLPGGRSSRSISVMNGPAASFVGGQWVPIDSIWELDVTVYRASFGGGVTRVPCGILNLAGGIDSLAIAGPVVVPDGCYLRYEVQISGVSIPVSSVTSGAHPLSGAVQSLPLTAVLGFTDALAPMLDVSGTSGAPGTGLYARLTKSATNFNHISATRTPSVAVTQVKESIVLDAFASATHTLTSKLQSGAGFATEAAPSNVTDVLQPDGSLLRTFTWALGAAVSDHRVRLIGATTDQTAVFSGRQANWSTAA